LERQRQDGTWFEPEFTGTGFPLVFYLKYHYYSVYFPLMALSLYAAKRRVKNVERCEEEVILPMRHLRIFSPEHSCYNNSRPDDPPPELPTITKTANKEAGVMISAPPAAKKPIALKLFLG
jgi:hypothetical protein